MNLREHVNNISLIRVLLIFEESKEDPLDKENGNPLHYCLGNPMDRGAWRASIHGVARVKHN